MDVWKWDDMMWIMQSWNWSYISFTHCMSGYEIITQATFPEYIWLCLCKCRRSWESAWINHLFVPFGPTRNFALLESCSLRHHIGEGRANASQNIHASIHPNFFLFVFDQKLHWQFASCSLLGVCLEYWWPACSNLLKDVNFISIFCFLLFFSCLVQEWQCLSTI